VLVGLMGSGKTTVGAALATRLGWPHRDSDDEIARSHDKSAREIATRDGIDHLHAIELAHLLDALVDPGPSVISAAASEIDEPVARAALDDLDVNVVWLTADPKVLAARASSAGHRPSPEPIETQAARREPLYAAVADRTVDVADRSVDQIVDAVLG
jgi:shikimate kinase/3-dehydroquinate synthase